MKLSTLLSLPATLLPLIYASSAAAPNPDDTGGTYTEHLHLRPLPDNSTLYAGFTFTSSTPLAAYTAQHYRLFPRSLAQILQYTHTAELHLRFALGRWDDEAWGSRPREGRREGGNGVELWAWVDGDGDGAEGRWSDLVNSLSGLFCASLNFVDSGRTIRPVVGFESEGTLGAYRAAQGGRGELELLHGMLPHEVVCTENLTPFLKLLPCKGKAGISSLLDGHKVFDANWQTMSIDVRPVCDADGRWCELEIQQTVDMVLDIERSSRPAEKRIPRPPPIEEVVCDEGKAYNGHDTCYPKVPEGEMGWRLSTLFGRPIKGSCPLSGNGHYDVTLETSPGRTIEVISNVTVAQSKSADGNAISYRIPPTADFDLDLPAQVVSTPPTTELPPLYATRQLTGYGQERGGMHIQLRNPHPYPQRLVYLESLPWYLRPYMHTLRIDGAAKVEKMYYKPLVDRQRGTHLELVLEVPAEGTVEMQYDFEKAVVRYTEYPPDANRGFDIPPAVVRILPKEGEEGKGGQGSYLRTTSLLLPLPTPDFSMPYNVIILTSTVIALGFGSIFNMLVRRFVLVEEVPVSPLVVGVGKLREKVKGLVGRGVVKGGEDGVVAGDRAVKGEGMRADGEGARANGANGVVRERRKGVS